MYLIKTPFWLRAFYPGCTWKMPSDKKVIYLTFDDGPYPDVTPFVLDQLNKFNAKATFFCIGKNVLAHSAIYGQIIKEGHALGNHTYDHLNGWQTDTVNYVYNIKAATHLISSNLFRPPYGRIKRNQLKQIAADQTLPQQIVMWDVLSGDFDIKINGKKCAQNIIKNAGPGSIIVFHDSTKAWERLQVALPAALEYFTSLGYRFECIK